jgi:hypothetical protein
VPAEGGVDFVVDLADLDLDTDFGADFVVDLAVDFKVDVDTTLDAGFLFVIFASAQGAA